MVWWFYVSPFSSSSRLLCRYFEWVEFDFSQGGFHWFLFLLMLIIWVLTILVVISNWCCILLPPGLSYWWYISILLFWFVQRLELAQIFVYYNKLIPFSFFSFLKFANIEGFLLGSIFSSIYLKSSFWFLARFEAEFILSCALIMFVKSYWFLVMIF